MAFNNMQTKKEILKREVKKMLKTELEKKLKDAEAKADDYQNDRARLLREAKTKDEEIEKLNEFVKYNSDQLKQIGQSIYTVLQVKYPDVGTSDKSEEERFLMFLHGLCSDRNYNMNSASDVFRHLS